MVESAEVDKDETPIGGLTRQQILVEELNTAVRLAFAEKSSDVAMLLIAYAAWDILDAMATRTGARTVRRMLEGMVASENKAKFMGYLKDPYNFLKHGKRDANEEMPLDRSGLMEWSHFILYAPCHDYNLLFGETTPEILTYRTIWRVHNGKAMVPPMTPEQMRAGTLLIAKSGGDPLKVIEFLEKAKDHIDTLKLDGAIY